MNALNKSGRHGGRDFTCGSGSRRRSRGGGRSVGQAYSSSSGEGGGGRRVGTSVHCVRQGNGGPGVRAGVSSQLRRISRSTVLHMSGKKQNSGPNEKNGGDMGVVRRGSATTASPRDDRSGWSRGGQGRDGRGLGNGSGSSKSLAAP